MTGVYDDIIHIKHHVSIKHPAMTAVNRAAQFSPFAALTGYDKAIQETARRTDERIEMDDCSTNDLCDRLQIIAAQMTQQPEIEITYFQPDRLKSGGAYVTAASAAKKIDEYRRIVIMTDGTEIPLDDIVSIEGAIFEVLSDQ